MDAKKIKYLWDGPFEGHYVRAWKEKREINVEVWLEGSRSTIASPPEEGLPDGHWVMPGSLGLEGCIKQAISQTSAT